jgi:hypothetical protein
LANVVWFQIGICLGVLHCASSKCGLAIKTTTACDREVATLTRSERGDEVVSDERHGRWSEEEWGPVLQHRLLSVTSGHRAARSAPSFLLLSRLHCVRETGSPQDAFRFCAALCKSQLTCRFIQGSADVPSACARSRALSAVIWMNRILRAHTSSLSMIVTTEQASALKPPPRAYAAVRRRFVASRCGFGHASLLKVSCQTNCGLTRRLHVTGTSLPSTGAQRLHLVECSCCRYQRQAERLRVNHVLFQQVEQGGSRSVGRQE